LGNIVFSDKNALSDLNKITHSAVKTDVLRQLQSKPRLAAIDAIGLFEGELAQLCDTTVAITAPEEMRVQRLMAREGISEEYARSRLAAQRSQADFEALCQHTLENDMDICAFRAKCLAFLQSFGIM
jgi:dephospho-CoA kinase